MSFLLPVQHHHNNQICLRWSAAGLRRSYWKDQDAAQQVWSVRSEVMQDFAVLGESADLMLAEDQSAVDFDIEDAPGAFDQLGFQACGFPDCSRQTDGFRGVVSHDAVGDADLHRLSSRVVRIQWWA